MILKFATKRGANGYRKFLGFDTEKKVFSRESAHWYCKEDIVEISATARKTLIERLEGEGYTEIDNI